MLDILTDLFTIKSRLFKKEAQHKKISASDHTHIIQLVQKIGNIYHLTIPSQAIRIRDKVIKIIISSDITKANLIQLFTKECQEHLYEYEIHCIQEMHSVNSPQKKIHSEISKKDNPTKRHYVPQNIRPLGMKKIIMVASGKGGVGKSAVSLNLARCLAKLGNKTAFIDCDIYGPSAPLMTGGDERAVYLNHKLQPIIRDNLKIMSMGFMVEPEKALIWRGPMVSSAIGQIFTQTDWGDIDIAIVDLPPGTGDAQLTLGQNLRPDGVIIVTQPQMMSVIDAQRCGAMFDKLSIPVIGVIENMSGFITPDTKKFYPIFGEGGGKNLADSCNYRFLGQLPLVPQVAHYSDIGVSPIDKQECQPFVAPLFDIAQSLNNMMFETKSQQTFS